PPQCDDEPFGDFPSFVLRLEHVRAPHVLAGKLDEHTPCPPRPLPVVHGHPRPRVGVPIGTDLADERRRSTVRRGRVLPFDTHAISPCCECLTGDPPP